LIAVIDDVIVPAALPKEQPSYVSAAEFAAAVELMAAVELIARVCDLLLMAIMAVAVAQFVLGRRTTIRFVHFSIGQHEWRMFRGLLLLMLLVAFAIVLPVRTLADREFPVSIVAFAGVAFVSILVARAWFYLPLASVLSPNARLRRSLRMSEGNTWRILALLVVVMLPSIAISFAETGYQLVAAGLSGSLNGLDDAVDFVLMERSSSIAPALSPETLLAVLVNSIGSVLFWGFRVTAAGLAFRAHYPLPDTTAEAFA